MEPFDRASAGGGTFSLEGRGVPGQGVENEPGGGEGGGGGGKRTKYAAGGVSVFFFSEVSGVHVLPHWVSGDLTSSSLL